MIKDVSIIVSAKDEEKSLKILLPKLKKISSDVIVVDGRSKDNTSLLCKKKKVRFFLDDGKGKGSAQRIGAKQANKKYLIFVDGDGAHDIPDVYKIRKFLKTNDLIICSRQTGGSYDLNIDDSLGSVLRAAGCIFLVFLVNKLFKKRFTDVLYSFKGISRKKFLKLNTKANSFEVELDILISSIKKNYKIFELPSRENARKYGVSKLKTITGINFIFYILYRRFLRSI